MTDTIADGKYTGKVGYYGFKTAGSGDVYLSLQFVLTDGRKCNRSLFFGEKSLEGSIRFLRALGWQGTDISTVAFDGKERELVIKANTKGYPEVKFVNQPRNPTKDLTDAKQKLAEVNSRIAAMEVPF